MRQFWSLSISLSVGLFDSQVWLNIQLLILTKHAKQYDKFVWPQKYLKLTKHQLHWTDVWVLSSGKVFTFLQIKDIDGQRRAKLQPNILKDVGPRYTKFHDFVLDFRYVAPFWNYTATWVENRCYFLISCVKVNGVLAGDMFRVSLMSFLTKPLIYFWRDVPRPSWRLQSGCQKKFSGRTQVTVGRSNNNNHHHHLFAKNTYNTTCKKNK